MRTVDYKENSAGPVARFTATDPERATPIFWSLPAAVTDTERDRRTTQPTEESFKIDQSGVLSFKEPS